MNFFGGLRPLTLTARGAIGSLEIPYFPYIIVPYFSLVKFVVRTNVLTSRTIFLTAKTLLYWCVLIGRSVCTKKISKSLEFRQVRSQKLNKAFSLIKINNQLAS